MVCICGLCCINMRTRGAWRQVASGRKAFDLDFMSSSRTLLFKKIKIPTSVCNVLRYLAFELAQCIVRSNKALSTQALFGCNNTDSD